MIGVYILCFDNGYNYIGCSKNISHRLSQHKYDLKAKNRLWYKYCNANLVDIKIIKTDNLEQAHLLEKLLIENSNCKLYNIHYKKKVKSGKYQIKSLAALHIN